MKILYLNHVCWEWIFQRPQILALKLQEDFECTVVNKKFIFGKTIAKNNKRPECYKTVFQIPKENKNSIIKKINEYIYKRALKSSADYDAIWVCHPSLFKYIANNRKNQLIIYDCMDDHIAMSVDSNRNEIEDNEKRLLSRANIVFVTSEYLKKKKKLENAILVRNAFELDRNVKPISKAVEKTKYIIGYIGTISKWFDFDLIYNTSNILDGIEYHLIGPIENNIDKKDIIEKHVIYDGIIEHDRLSNGIEEFDALIMPFVTNEIVLSVDPVKLYEYISFGKCIISVYYDEIARFEHFVYFYHNEEEYIKIIQELIKSGFKPKYSEELRQGFLANNSWEQRYSQIKDAILSYNSV